MCAPSPAVLPSAGGVPRRAASVSLSVAPARVHTSACLTKTARNDRSSVVTAAGMEVLSVGAEMPSQDLLQKRLASELDALHGILKNVELISQRGACKGGAPTAGKKERFLGSKQPPKPIEEDFNAPSVKRRKISTLVEQKQKPTPAPRMSPEERNQLACRLSSLCGELPGHIAEFLQKQFGNADADGEIEINMDSAEDSVLFELRTRLDRSAEESKGEVVPEQENEEYIDICGLSPDIETGNTAASSSNSGGSDSGTDSDSGSESDSDSDSESDSGSESDSDQIKGTSAHQPSEPASGTTAQSTAQAVSSVSGDSIGVPALRTAAASGAAQSGEAKKAREVQRAAAPKTVPLAGLIYKANLRRQLLEMERAVLPDQRIDPRDLQRLGITEYGHPSLMRELGLVLKAVEA